MKRLWDRFKKGKRQCEVSDNVDGPLTLKSLALRCVLPTIDKIGSNGLSPLHVVCVRGRADCLRLLLKWRKNANLNVQGWKSVAIWKERGNCECVRLLLSHGAKAHVVAVAGIHKKTPLQYAAQLGDVGIARILLDHKAKVNYSARYNKTPIHHAVVDGNRDCVRLLLERGADPNICRPCNPHNRRQDFPLHVAGLNGDEEIVKLLLKYGADVNQLEAQECTAVHRAAEGGSTAALSVLLATNASVNQFDSTGHSPLHYALHKSHYDCSKILLDHGADLNAGTGLSFGPSALVSLLCSKSCTVELVELLLSKGANVNNRNVNFLNISNNIDYSPLYMAVKCQGPDIVRCLLASGADTSLILKNDRTILMEACSSSRIQLSPQIAAENVCLLAYTKGMNLNHRETRRGYTALHICAINELADGARVLLDAGANPKVLNYERLTPYQLCQFEDSKTRTVFQEHEGKVRSLEFQCRVVLLKNFTARKLANASLPEGMKSSLLAILAV